MFWKVNVFSIRPVSRGVNYRYDRLCQLVENGCDTPFIGCFVAALQYFVERYNRVLLEVAGSTCCDRILFLHANTMMVDVVGMALCDVRFV